MIVNLFLAKVLWRVPNYIMDYFHQRICCGILLGYIKLSKINGNRHFTKNEFIQNFFSKWDQIRSLLRIWPHLLKKSLMENFEGIWNRNIGKKWVNETRPNLITFSPLSASVALIKKPVKWFAQQISWLVSIWRQHSHLML